MTEARAKHHAVRLFAGAALGIAVSWALRQDGDWGIVAAALTAAFILHRSHCWLMDVWIPRADQLQRALMAGGALTVAGLALAGARLELAGRVVSLLGWLVLMYSIHLYGRLGPAAGA